MPRTKAPAPQRLSDQDRVGVTLNLLDSQNQDNATGNTASLQGHNNEEIIVSEEEDDEDIVVVREEIVLKSESEADENNDDIFCTYETFGRPKSKRKRKHAREENEDPNLNSILEDCQFFISLKSELAVGKEERLFFLGHLEISVLKPDDEPLPSCSESWLYVSEVPGRSMLYFEWKDSLSEVEELRVRYYLVKGKLNMKVYSGFEQKKVFKLTFRQENVMSSVVNLSVYISNVSLPKLSHPSDYVVSWRPSQDMMNTMDFFLNVAKPEFDSNLRSKVHDIAALYDVVKKCHAQENLNASVDVQHDSLLPDLRPYQKAAVQWMLHRERKPKEEEIAALGKLHPLYETVVNLHGEVLYYNKYKGFWVFDKPLESPLPTGGILADEMGLGKTVEVLACMLCNPRKFDAEKSDVKEADGNNSVRLPVKTQVKEEKYDTLAEERQSNDDGMEVKDCARNEIETDGARTESKVSTSDFRMDIAGTSRDFISSSTRTNTSESACKLSVEHEDVVEQRKQNVQHKARGLNTGAVDGCEGCDVKNTNESQAEVCAVDCIPCSVANIEKNTSSVIVPHRNNEAESGIESSLDSNIGVTESAANKYTESNKYSGRNVTRNVASMEVCGTSGIVDSGLENSVDSVVVGMTDSMEVGSEEIVYSENSIARSSTVLDVDIVDEDNCKSSRKKGASKGSGCTLSSRKRRSTRKRDTYDYFDGGSSSVGSGSGSDDDPSYMEKTPKSRNTERKQCRGKIKMDSLHGVKDKVITRSTRTKQRQRKKIAQETQAERPLTMREKMQIILDMKLAPYSGKRLLEDEDRIRKNREFFNTRVSRKTQFECLCGADGSSGEETAVCSLCTSQQHAACVNYDMSDPESGTYLCPHCLQDQKVVPSGATLIVSPGTISYQWIAEIQRHVKEKGIKTLFYRGVSSEGFIQPRTLASYDIVITSYEILRKEIVFVDTPHHNSESTRRFRQPKRFLALPSPLPCIEWWRLCLDEAQMVECTTTKSAQMAHRLSAVHRWCITGTPIEKSLSDLHGLLLFLGVDPYCIQPWFEVLLYNPYCHGSKEPLERVISQILWRTAKKDVLDQINIPKQCEKIHWLNFSPVEEHFYRRQHVVCSHDLINTLRRFHSLDAKLSSFDRSTVNVILAPLLTLRQACCHPQAVKGQFIPLRKSTMTMEELLESLIKKTSIECEEAHRQHVAALNGLAGILVIKHEWEEAVETYREVLRTIEEHKNKLKTDTLQRLHTLHNLVEILESGHSVPPTLRDSSLKNEAMQMEKKYMEKCLQKVIDAQETVARLSVSVNDLMDNFTLSSPWWEEIVTWSSMKNIEEDLIRRVKDDLSSDRNSNTGKDHSSLSNRFNNASGLGLLLAGKLEELHNNRAKVLKELRDLEVEAPINLVNDAVDCHLRSAPRKKNRCRLCKAHDIIESYEEKLFRILDKKLRHTMVTNVQVLGELRRGSWADSQVERILKVLISFARSKKGDVEWVEDGKNHLNLLEAMKKEFKNLRILWRQLNDQVSAIDEVNMAKLRLRLRLPDEPRTSKIYEQRNPLQNLSSNLESKVETIYIIDQHELEPHASRLQSEKILAKGELRKKLGQLLYLKNLQKANSGRRGAQNPELCPICQRSLNDKWAVLQCGHSFCLECMEMLVLEYNRVGRHSVKCAVCREFTLHGEISFVNTKVDENETDRFSVRGSHSTKVEAVVKTLLMIKEEEPDAKVLVFSTWANVLKVVSQACKDNNISCVLLESGRNFQQSLRQFKDSSKGITTLLLPVRSGANGLNIIEATHVLLVEPILNPASELQAIGRVHRIGQTKATWVHRFLVRGTIEEKLYEVLRTHRGDNVQSCHKTEESTLTLRELKELFVGDQPTVPS